MADPMSGPDTRCPWCSAELPDASAEQCPSCGAILVAAPDIPGEIKGVTTLDTEAILRARSEVSRPRSNRLISFITGETPADADEVANPASLARPADAVRREMLRLQLEAETADLQAETVALKADELARIGIPLSELGGPEGQAPDDAPEGEWPPEPEPGKAAEPPEAPAPG